MRCGANRLERINLPLCKDFSLINSVKGLVNKKRKEAERAIQSIKDQYKYIESDIELIKINFGQLLIFNQGLPHGNRVNLEGETRWSMNCRFKGVFTPYKDKKVGDFFEPITLRPASLNGIGYIYPEVKSET